MCSPWLFKASTRFSATDSKVKRHWSLSVLECTDELVNILRCERLCGDCIDQRIDAGAFLFDIFHFSTLKVRGTFFESFFQGGHTNDCLRESVCSVSLLVLCTCGVTRAPWPQIPSVRWMDSPPSLFEAETEPNEAWDVSGEVGRGWGGVTSHAGVAFALPWQRSEVTPFSIHLTAESDRVMELGLIKTSGFWQLWLGCMHVCLSLRWAKGSQGAHPGPSREGQLRHWGLRGPLI